MKIKKTFWFFLFLFIGLSLFIREIFNTGFENIFQALKDFSLLKFLIFVAISFVNFSLFSWRWQLVVKQIHKGKKIKPTAFFMDRMAGYAVSYVTPMAQLGGEPLRLMLIQEEGVSRKTAISSTIIEKALELSTLILFISAGILITLIEPWLPLETKIPLAIVGAVMLFAVIWFYVTSYTQIGFLSSIFNLFKLNKFKRLRKYCHKMNKFEKEMNAFYQNHTGTMNLLILISLITVVFILIEHFLVAYFLGVKLTFLETFLISTIPYIAYMLPVPAGLGALESGAALIFLILGVEINAFAFIFIIRLRDFIFVSMGLVRGSQKAFSIMKKEFQEDFNLKHNSKSN
ncbi:flippase-like domain-containing protein [Candidatus Peregrinibacteria bacterium]|nr:flippase-like domain-containing protein [Candidatus Peregrinibacteria bacterium]